MKVVGKAGKADKAGKFAVASLCRKAEPTDECRKAFRSWLVAEQGYTEGTARDYAWSFKCLLKLKGNVKRGTEKMRSVYSVARGQIDAFMKLPKNRLRPEFRNAKHVLAQGQASSSSSTGKTHPKKVQGSSSASTAGAAKKKSLAKQLRTLARRKAGKSSVAPGMAKAGKIQGSSASCSESSAQQKGKMSLAKQLPSSGSNLAAKSKSDCAVGKAAKFVKVRGISVAATQGKSSLAKKLRVLARETAGKAKNGVVECRDPQAQHSSTSIPRATGKTKKSLAKELLSLARPLSHRAPVQGSANSEVQESCVGTLAAEDKKGKAKFKSSSSIVKRRHKLSESQKVKKVCISTDSAQHDQSGMLDWNGDREEHSAEIVPEEAVTVKEVDSRLAVISAGVRSASHLSKQCSDMLADMLPFSLALAAEERADCQQRIVDMAEEVLHTVKSELEMLVAASDSKLDELMATIAELRVAAKEADSQFATWSASWRASLDEATAAANASGQILAEKRSVQAMGTAKLNALQEEIVTFQKSFEKHFQKPLKAGGAPHFKELEPFLQKMDIEESLHRALPRICAKSSENRTESDDATLEQLAMSFAVKISTLTESVATETEAVADLESEVQEAEKNYRSKKEMQDRSTVEFEAALKQQGGGQEALIKGYKANQSVNELEIQVQAATRLRDTTREKLIGFESGPFASFMEYKTKGSSSASERHATSSISSPSASTPNGENASAETATLGLSLDSMSVILDAPLSETGQVAEPVDPTGIVDMLSAEFGEAMSA
jgi:hypothetical protein